MKFIPGALGSCRSTLPSPFDAPHRDQGDTKVVKFHQHTVQRSLIWQFASQYGFMRVRITYAHPRQPFRPVLGEMSIDPDLVFKSVFRIQ